MDDYRQRKELFISNLNGTTLYETGSLMINICSSYFLCQILKSSLKNVFLEYFILVIPMVLVCTILSSISQIFHLIIWSIAFIIYFLSKPNFKTKEFPSTNNSYSRIIEIFRGQTLLVTCICILAVDFPIFPRRYAKTEDYGYSGMDLGVGLFSLAHGMVSSEARNKQTKFKELFIENILLLTLGIIRFISIKYFSYIEHVSEYGVHWNFFLTLCFMKLIGNLLLLITKNLLVLIISVLFFHEFILLKYFQYDSYLMSNDNSRENFLDANREGIYSLSGYVCLYLIGIYIGRLVIKGETKQEFKQMSGKFILAMIILCGLCYKPSRKLCNLSYITGTTGLACMCMGGFCITQWLLRRKDYSTESILLKNVNQKGIDVFLLANVLTGLINLNVNTLDTSNITALGILFTYMFIVTTFAYFCPSIVKLTLKYLKLTK